MSPVKFTGIDIDAFDDDICFRSTVDPSGFKGYDKFNATLQNNGNSLTIKFETDNIIPSCPW